MRLCRSFQLLLFGLCPVRSNRSNPALKQDLAKARFLEKNTTPQICSPQEANRGGDCFAKPVASRNGNGGADLAFAKACQEICVR